MTCPNVAQISRPARSSPNSTSTSSVKRKAKRAVAIALRNRYRREKLPEEMRREVIPKNILMIGPTGVGKTEIARRLASARRRAVRQSRSDQVHRGRLRRSRRRVDGARSGRSRDPHGGEERRADVEDAAERAAVERVIECCTRKRDRPRRPPPNPFAATFGSIFGNNFGGQNAAQSPPATTQTAPPDEAARIRDSARADVLRGFYDVRLVEIEVEEAQSLPIGMIGGDMMNQGGGDIGEMLGGLMPKKRAKKRVTIAEARRIFAAEEEGKLIDMDAVKREALRRAGENGIIFIDEIDKVAGSGGSRGPDVSREGVQRDILPIVEG